MNMLRLLSASIVLPSVDCLRDALTNNRTVLARGAEKPRSES